MSPGALDPREVLRQCRARSYTMFLLRYSALFPAGIMRIAASGLFFALPFGLWAWWLQEYREVAVLRRTILLAGGWVVFGPFIIYQAYCVYAGFLGGLKRIMPPAGFEAFTARATPCFLGNRHLPYSLAIAPAIALLAGLFSHRLGDPPAAVTWHVTVFFVIGFTTGVGFWGVISLATLIREATTRISRIDFGHPDGFGGLRFVSSTLAKMTALYFSGSLFIPFMVDLIALLGSSSANLLAYLLLAAYIGLGLATFLHGIMTLHDFILEQKVLIEAESARRLDALLDAAVQAPAGELATVLKPLVYQHCYHNQISDLREYPFELRTLLELTASVLIPVTIFLVDKLLR